jgi:hypothetical protein
MILLFLGPILLNSQTGQLPLSTIELTLILLSMQWWALVVQHFVGRGISTKRARILQVGGLCGALLITLLIAIFTADSIIYAVIISAAAVLWSWKRGIDRTRAELNEEQLINAFKIGFIIVIGMLMFTIILPSQSFKLPIDVLAQALPLFFFSGLLALSFTRLIQIQKENARHPTSKKDPTRSWALALTGLWIALVIAAIALETFSFTIIQRILLPIWDLLGWIVLWIIEGFFFLLSTIFNFFFKPSTIAGLPPKIKNSGSRAPQASPHPKVAPPSQELVLLGRIVLLVIVIIVVIFFVRLALGRLKTRVEDEAEEEEREGLDIGAILNERREEWQRKRQKQETFTLEALDPHSVRARYRDLLSALQEDSAGLAHLPGETPQEYQKRLDLAIRIAPPSIGQPSLDAPPEAAILEELTEAYARERYGARPLEMSKEGYLSTWVPYLIQRLHRPKPATQKQIEDRWGP